MLLHGLLLMCPDTQVRPGVCAAQQNIPRIDILGEEPERFGLIYLTFFDHSVLPDNRAK